MLDLFPTDGTEPEAYTFLAYLKGAGAFNPTRNAGRNNYSIVRTAVGRYTMTFPDNPGPTFMGLNGTFGDPAPANVMGWTAVAVAYTPPTAGAAATLQFAVANAADVAADIPATSFLAMQILFKRADTNL